MASLKNGEIRIFGWFLCEDINGNFILPERIYSILDQNEILQGSPVSPRPDVGRVYPSAPLNAGFDFRCREPRHSVSVWVLNTGGSLSQGRPGNYYPQRKDDL
ncbi:MAG: hypothetical protein LBJ14_03185 [Desulfarculales bacterium]|nr:hypothetical protein [Desulfarculales bacterium]